MFRLPSLESPDKLVQRFHDASPVLFQTILLAAIVIAAAPSLQTLPNGVVESEFHSLMRFAPSATLATPVRLVFLLIQLGVLSLFFNLVGVFTRNQLQAKLWGFIVVLAVSNFWTLFRFDIAELEVGLRLLIPSALALFALLSLTISKSTHTRLLLVVLLALFGKIPETKLALLNQATLVAYPPRHLSQPKSQLASQLPAEGSNRSTR